MKTVVIVAVGQFEAVTCYVLAIFDDPQVSIIKELAVALSSREVNYHYWIYGFATLIRLYRLISCECVI